MTRFFSPPKDELNKLRTELTPGEKSVCKFFNRHLDEDWDIYIQPHLNGLRPDFVLLNPKTGIAVFEVKDWNLDVMEYYIKNQSGKPPILMAKKNKKEFSIQRDNPIEKVYRYKNEIYELYCPRLKERSGLALITAGVIFPFADDNRVKTLFLPSREYRNMLEYKKYYPISGCNSLNSENLSKVFPEGKRKSSDYMNSDIVKDLKNWLVEPDFSSTQRTPLELDETQKRYVITRTKTGYRRIKGPAGSGKSLVIAARASQLASEGKNVLVVTYNITLLNYLKDLSTRWRRDNLNKKGDITWLYFHSWCKRICQENNYEEEYKAIWQRHNKINEDEIQGTGKDLIQPLNEISELVSSIIDNDNEEHIEKYDAILVDEGQDFLPEWWNIVRKICKKNGEMLLAADATQDIYGTAKSWTDQAMKGAGFKGEWAELEFSYRMPPKLIHFARSFAKQFLQDGLVDLPSSPQRELDIFPCKLRWVQISKERAINICKEEILSMAPSADPSILSMADITFLSNTNNFGYTIISDISINGVKFVHTFSEDSRERRRKKLVFYMGDARLKATTLHSFKGWESRSLIVYIGHKKDIRAMHLAYTGMTRLKRHVDGSYLTIICAIKELEEYGRTWPEFEYK